MTARILACEPPRLLSFVWGEEEGVSRVTFELTGEGSSVRLVLTHTKLSGIAEMRDVSSGWHIHLAMLEDLLNGRPLRPFWSTLDRLEAEYRKRIG